MPGHPTHGALSRPWFVKLPSGQMLSISMAAGATVLAAMVQIQRRGGIPVVSSTVVNLQCLTIVFSLPFSCLLTAF